MIQYKYTVTVDDKTWVFSNDTEYTEADIKAMMMDTMGYLAPFDITYTQQTVEV